jgi:hypothetical protein
MKARAAESGKKDLADRAAPIVVALFTHVLRRLIPSLRSKLPPPHDLLVWQRRRRALELAAAQRRRERRRKIAIAATSVVVAAALTTVRVLTRR